MGDQEHKAEEMVVSQEESSPVDTLLSHVGEMGLYQKLLFLAMLPFGLFFAFVYFVQMFIAATPQKHWCKIPELAHLPMEQRRELSAPPTSDSIGWERCYTYDTDWSQVLETLVPPPENTPLVPCPHGWEFELTDIPYATVVSERDWVCDKASIVPLAQAVFFIGAMTGGVVFGWLADRFGRIPALIGANLIGGIGGVATIFTTTAWDFILCRFLVGMSYDNVFMIMYILVLEYTGPRYRTVVANMSIALYFGGGCLSLPWLALWVSNWRVLILITSVPMFIVVVVPFLIPESVRWLISRSRIDKAVEMIRRVEKVNKAKVPDDAIDNFTTIARETKEKNESLLVLLKSPGLRVTMIQMVMVYMATSIAFDGLVRSSESIGLDFFIQFTLTSATEVPSLALLTVLLDRLGRRNMAAGSMGTSSVLMLIAIFVPAGIPQGVLSIMARFFMNMCFNTAIQWVTELLPTPVRGSGSAAMHMSGYAGAMASPYIIYSERIWRSLPLLIMGVIGIIGATIALFVPETNGRPMPQTIADGEKIVREGKLFKRSKKSGDKDCEVKNDENELSNIEAMTTVPSQSVNK